MAKLAGLPGKVVTRAGEVLRRLEKSGRRNGGSERVLEDLPLFAVAQPEPRVLTAVSRGPTPLEALIDATNADELTPRAALELLYRIKELRTADNGQPDAESPVRRDRS